MEKKLGDQEISLLRFVGSSQPITAGEVYSEYGEPAGLARSTIETMLERLRKKGYLTRSRDGGVFRYEQTSSQSDLLNGLVAQFVEKTLGGSLEPFVAYFVQRQELDPSEIAELERLLRKMKDDSE